MKNGRFVSRTHPENSSEAPVITARKPSLLEHDENISRRKPCVCGSSSKHNAACHWPPFTA